MFFLSRILSQLPRVSAFEGKKPCLGGSCFSEMVGYRLGAGRALWLPIAGQFACAFTGPFLLVLFAEKAHAFGAEPHWHTAPEQGAGGAEHAAKALCNFTHEPRPVINLAKR